MKKWAIGISIGVVAAAFMLAAGNGHTWSSFSNCGGCHGGWGGPGETLHDTHTALIDGNCNMCHPSGAGSKPVKTNDAGDDTAFSCLGCHGRDYGAAGMQSAGLRRHHANAPEPVSCSPCHDGDPEPLAETVPPPHYGRTDVFVTMSCSDGLDNDGDYEYDNTDADCLLPVEDTTWGKIKSLYN